jgi:hemerythrin-like metal-binding protein
MNRPLFIQWDKRSETGIAILDEQHQGIVSIINSFYYLVGLKAGNNVLYASIGETVKNYSRIHFITEERLLEATAYPAFEEHRKMHAKLLQSMERIEFDAVRNNDSKPLLDFLKEWWLGHINEQDQLYVRHLHANSKSLP